MSDANTNAHSEGSRITRCQILRGPDEDSLAVLLNAIHRDAQEFVERRVEPEISWRTRLQRRRPPGANRTYATAGCANRTRGD